MTIVSRVMGTPPLTTALGMWTRKKQPTSVVVTVTNASEGNTVWFYTRSMVPIGASTVDSSGEAHFYDLDDGSYTAYEVTTGNAWSIVVSGATATVTPIASTGIAGFAHFG